MKKNKWSSDTEKRVEKECPPVWRIVHLHNPTIANLVKKFPFMEPPIYMYIFTRTCNKNPDKKYVHY
jgi:hypothetical protein